MIKYYKPQHIGFVQLLTTIYEYIMDVFCLYKLYVPVLELKHILRLIYLN